jgi:polysaccharide biosynthesis protein PelA
MSMSLVSLSTACGGGAQPSSATPEAGVVGGGAADTAGAGGPAAGAASAASFRGDDSPMPSFGGWGAEPLPAEAVARAGFEWFETGYPGDARTNEILANAGVRPFAYVNLSELDGALWEASGYAGDVLRTNGDWGLEVIDVTHPSWQDWLVRRADEAYRTGSRGIKWDAATPEVPPGKTRADVNDAIASAMRRILEQHPDLKFIFNQGFDFAEAYPELVHGMETEGLFSTSSFPEAYLEPWKDPWYWGPQFEKMKALKERGIPVFVAEYADPFGGRARELYDAITASGFVPYITSEAWNARGRGYGVEPGW